MLHQTPDLIEVKFFLKKFDVAIINLAITSKAIKQISGQVEHYK